MGFWNSRHNWARISAKYRNDRVMRDLQRRRNAYYDALNMKIGLCVFSLIALIVASIALLLPSGMLAEMRMPPIAEFIPAIFR